jgi:hypothetical protein
MSFDTCHEKADRTYRITVLVALPTVGIQAIKAAIANPVDSLRNEWDPD